MDASREGRARASAVAASVLLIAALAGCSSGVAHTEADDLAIFTDAGFLTGDEAAISGVLAVTGAGCIGITDAQGATYPAVWPRGTSLGMGPAVDVPGVGTIELGAAVHGAGGYYEASTRPALDEVAERCDWEGEIIGIRFE